MLDVLKLQKGTASWTLAVELVTTALVLQLPGSDAKILGGMSILNCWNSAPGNCQNEMPHHVMSELQSAIPFGRNHSTGVCCFAIYYAEELFPLPSIRCTGNSSAQTSHHTVPCPEQATLLRYHPGSHRQGNPPMPGSSRYSTVFFPLSRKHFHRWNSTSLKIAKPHIC